MASADNILGNCHKFQEGRPILKIEVPEEDAIEICIEDVFDPSEYEDLEKADKVTNLPKTEDDTKKLLNKENNQEALKHDSEYSDSGETHNVFNETNNLETGEQLVLNFNKKDDNTHKRKKDCNDTKEINWANIYRTYESTGYQEVREKLKKVTVIAAPETATVIEPHEFTKLGFKDNICNHCQRIYTELSQLKRHIRSEHRDVTTMYQCPYCPYKSKRMVKNHIISRHMNEEDIKWLECYTCNKKFKNKTKLRVHILTHLGTAQLGDYMKQCTICSKIFKNGDGLNRHIQHIHNKKSYKRIQCQHCEYSSVLIPEVKKHIEVYHTTPDQRRTYECEQCDYKTTFEYKFKQHKKTHKEEYFRHRCDKCAFACALKSRLKLHQVIHQTTQDGIMFKYRCDKCDYKSHRSYSLQVHKLNHLKPNEIEYFYCYHCDFKAKRKDNLKTHVLKHFKREEVVFQCFNCDFSTKNRNLLSDHLEQKHSKAQKQPT